MPDPWYNHTNNVDPQRFAEDFRGEPADERWDTERWLYRFGVIALLFGVARRRRQETVASQAALPSHQRGRLGWVLAQILKWGLIAAALYFVVGFVLLFIYAFMFH